MSGWIEGGNAKLERMRPIAQRHSLTMMQLAAQWNLAHPTVACVAPSLIQESGPGARTIEHKREELAALPTEVRLSAAEVDELRAIGDNGGSMALKGASPVHEGQELPDQWSLSDDLGHVAERWAIDPARDLVKSA